MVVYERNVFNYHSTVMSMSKCQVLIFSDSNAWFLSELKWSGTLKHLESCPRPLPWRVSQRWLSVLANLSGTARAGNEKPPLQRGNGSSPWQQPKRQEGQGVSLGDLWREKFTWKILQRLSFSASHTINGREWMWPNILNFLSHQPPANNSHISFLNVQKVKRWNIRS